MIRRKARTTPAGDYAGDFTRAHATLENTIAHVETLGVVPLWAAPHLIGAVVDGFVTHVPVGSGLWDGHTRHVPPVVLTGDQRRRAQAVLWYGLEPACVACGEPPDYCQGHSRSDMWAWAQLEAHERGDHSLCQADRCSQGRPWLYALEWPDLP